MSEWIERASARLEDECKSGKFDKYGSAMKEAVKTALLDFCRQDDEFAQAVVQGGGSRHSAEAYSGGAHPHGQDAGGAL